MNLRKLKKEYKRIHFWYEGFKKASWYSPALGQTDEDRQVRLKIETQLHEIKKLIDQLMVPKLGKATVYELVSGDKP